MTTPVPPRVYTPYSAALTVYSNAERDVAKAMAAIVAAYPDLAAQAEQVRLALFEGTKATLSFASTVFALDQRDHGPKETPLALQLKAAIASNPAFAQYHVQAVHQLDNTMIISFGGSWTQSGNVAAEAKASFGSLPAYAGLTFEANTTSELEGIGG